MLVTLTNPSGVDIPIGKFQTWLHQRVLKALNIVEADYCNYPRCYRNQTADGYVPEVFTGGTDYNEVLFDDNFKLTSFFSLGESVKLDGSYYKASLSLVVMGNLQKIYPLSVDRQDENLRVAMEGIFEARAVGFIMTGVDTGIDKVFKEYSGYRVKNGIKFRDQHPNHCFRINFDLTYNNFKPC